MFPSLRRALVGTAALALSLSSFAVDTANAYPDQPIKIIVTFPPGGSADIVIRALQPVVSETLRQTIIIENRAGAGGNIGIGAVAKSAPDGYTLGVAAAGVLTVNPHLSPATMPFDPFKDLTPVTMLAEIPFVLVASQQSGITSVKEVIAKAKAEPQGLSIGHGGNGTAMHLTSALFNQKAGVRLQLVAYRGTAPASVDVLAGPNPHAVLDIPARDVPARRRPVGGPGSERIRIGRLVRPRRTRWYVARDHQHAERCFRKGLERSRRDRKNSCARRRTRAEFARRFCKVHPERKREMGQADRRHRDQGRIARYGLRRRRDISEGV